MEKKEIIEKIKEILSNYGCFDIHELDQEHTGIAVGSLGNIVGIAEYYTEDYCEVRVYNPIYSSDEIDSYEAKYEDLDEDVLSEVLILCEEWEAQNIQTEKRISD